MGKYDDVSVDGYDVSGKVDSGVKTEYSDDSNSVFSNLIGGALSAISTAKDEGNQSYENPFGLKDPDEYNQGSSSHYYPSEMYGYGSKAGSGNYSPKIYSNSRSLNASRPSTMYSKQPRDASYSYLRPSFTTQGSRSAYER